MSVATPTILSGNTPMPQEYELLSIDIRSEVNRIPTAEIRLIDGNAAKQVFERSNAAFFEPGAKITLKLRYEDGKDFTLFKGIVVRHTVEANADGSALVIGLKDEAVKLTAIRISAVYTEKTDDQIMEGIIRDAGLNPADVVPTNYVHPTMVQYDSTTWDFLALRAEANGMLITVDQGNVSVLPMSGNRNIATRVFNWGVDEILDFEFEANAMHPYAEVESAAWDPKRVSVTNPKVPSTAKPTLPGNLEAAELAKAVARKTYTLSHPVPAVEGELKAWADARLSRSHYSMLRGRIAFEGRGDIHLLDPIELRGIGQRFNGKTFVTGICHTYDANGWRTDLQFGLAPERACEREDIVDVGARGLLPASRGLQIGTVAAFEVDPQKELRVKVILPGVDEKSTGAIWARLATPEAGKNRGFFFRPQEGDEVVVGFLHDDPRHPVILGSLFGSKNTAPSSIKAPSATNDSKGIVTNKGLKVIFGDTDKPCVTIETPANNKVFIDDASGSISLTDQHGHKITLDSKGITIDAGNGDVVIKGAKVDVQ